MAAHRKLNAEEEESNKRYFSEEPDNIFPSDLWEVDQMLSFPNKDETAECCGYWKQPCQFIVYKHK